MQQTFSFLNGTQKQLDFLSGKWEDVSSNKAGVGNMEYNYRGFDLVPSPFGGWVIYERGKLLEDCATAERAEDRVNLIVLERSREDQEENARMCRKIGMSTTYGQFGR